MSEEVGSRAIPNTPAPNQTSEPITDRRARLLELAADLQTAIAHHRAGRVEEAAALYNKLLDAVPTRWVGSRPP
jgi:hypothetical protein